MKVKIRSKIPLLEAQLSGKIRHDAKTSGAILFAELVQSLDDLLPNLRLTRLLYVYIDELEVFFQTPEQYRRDLRLVRDMIFAVDGFVRSAAENGLALLFCVAVRTEILDALGAEGQEVSRIAHDRGANVAWHYGKRSLHHPLLEMVRRKIWISEDQGKVDRTADPIQHYFPKQVLGMALDVFLLDHSFYKPRDIIWRLTIAQQQFANEPLFDEKMFIATDIDYSAKLWEEIVYELSASYSSEEIVVIEQLFVGQLGRFSSRDIQERLSKKAASDPIAKKLEARRPVGVILQDLYRLGAIGNVFLVKKSIRHRWMFRGESSLLLDRHMELHPALTKRLKPIMRRRQPSVSKGRAPRE